MKAESIAEPIQQIIGDGVVHSVFQRSCNLLISERLVGVVSPVLGNNPNSLIVSDDFFARHLEQGMVVRAEGKQLRIGSDLVIKFEQTKIWNPELRLSISESRSIFLKLEELLRKKNANKNFLMRIVQKKPGQIFFADEFEQKIATKFLRFLKMFFAQKQNQKRLLEAASDLVGLGIGLTPAGDDFLAGMVATFHCFKQPTKLDLVLRNAIATSQTTTISNALFSSALQGWFCEKISDLLLSLQNHRSNNFLLQKKLNDVLAIGHSSGFDTLAGIYVALRFLVQP